MTESACVQRRGNALLLHVHVQPGASSTEVVGQHGGRLKIRLRATARDGEANQSLCEFLASEFKVRKNEVELLRGLKQRDKTILIHQPRCSPGWLPPAPS